MTLDKMTASIQYYGVMWLFGGCCIGLAVFAFFFIPETKGKSFEEIQAYFDNRSKAKTVEPAATRESSIMAQ